ncbi:hypothetical protein DPMN_096814 [Dreissena polymorpha]|uniref:Uncharacterized protein n=1 Tax=Dreissena polymorpha TaxID=45954 RepID=A0A9D4LC36_DREPO|nr:hypothetical protein DPMN_096814 [Dreissena polymorpha]
MFLYSQIWKSAPTTGGHVFQRIGTTFELNQDIITFELDRDFIGTKLLTKFHEDGTRNVAYRVFMSKCLRTDGRTYDGQRPCSSHFHVITRYYWDKSSDQVSRRSKINVASRVLTRKNAPPPDSHVFQPTGIIFELFQDIIRMNLLTKFHEDRTVNVASRVLTRFYYSHIRKNAPPLGSHFFQANIIIFELIQD